MHSPHSFLKWEFYLLKRQFFRPIIELTAFLHIEFDAVIKKNQIESHKKMVLRANPQHRANLHKTTLQHRLFHLIRRHSLNPRTHIPLNQPLLPLQLKPLTDRPSPPLNLTHLPKRPTINLRSLRRQCAHNKQPQL